MKNELLAPNGKPSNLNATQYKLVRTPAFKKWFGDWENDPANASKVVDENGEPLVVYHTTSKDFYVFDKKKSKEGFFFSPNKSRLSVYNKSKTDSYFLNIVNPSHEIFKSDLKYLIPKGYDGIMDYGHARHLGNKNLYEIIAFESNQIKLSDGTNTTFDSSNVDIRFKDGGQFNNKGFIVEELDQDLKEVYQNRAFKNISGSDFFFSRLNIYPLQNVFTIELPNGEEIGRATLNEKENYLTNIRINENYRRKGLALNLYDFIEYVIGKKLKPSPDKISKEAEMLWVKRNSDIRLEKGGRTISQTPSPSKDQIYGSNLNKKSSSKNLSNAKLIKFDEKTIEAIKNKVAKHNEEYPNKKINLASAKAVVRRGFGAYSSSHRPTISGGKPNSRVAWGLARLNAFIYKIVNGKSKSGKYSQDDDLIEELGYKVADYKNGGKMEKDIRCINCGWEWNKKDSELWDMYVCHKCGFDNTTFYTSIPINNYSKGGETKTKSPNYLKMFLGM